MNITALSAIKFGVSGIVGIGTGKVVGKIIRNNAGDVTNLIDKVSMTAATWVISGIATTAAKKFTNDSIDDIYTTVKGQIDHFKLSAKLSRISDKKSTFEAEGLNKDDYILDVKSGSWKPRTVQTDS